MLYAFFHQLSLHPNFVFMRFIHAVYLTLVYLFALVCDMLLF